MVFRGARAVARVGAGLAPALWGLPLPFVPHFGNRKGCPLARDEGGKLSWERGRPRSRTKAGGFCDFAQHDSWRRRKILAVFASEAAAYGAWREKKSEYQREWRGKNGGYMREWEARKKANAALPKIEPRKPDKKTAWTPAPPFIQNGRQMPPVLW